MTYRIETEHKVFAVVGPLSMRDIVGALRFKAANPKAQAPAEMWTAFADYIDSEAVRLTPKHVKIETRMIGGDPEERPICPACGNLVDLLACYGEVEQPYCDMCGQALDWSEDEC